MNIVDFYFYTVLQKMREYGDDNVLYALKLKSWLRSNSVSFFLLRNQVIDTV